MYRRISQNILTRQKKNLPKKFKGNASEICNSIQLATNYIAEICPVEWSDRVGQILHSSYTDMFLHLLGSQILKQTTRIASSLNLTWRNIPKIRFKKIQVFLYKIFFVLFINFRWLRIKLHISSKTNFSCFLQEQITQKKIKLHRSPQCIRNKIFKNENISKK